MNANSRAVVILRLRSRPLMPILALGLLATMAGGDARAQGGPRPEGRGKPAALSPEDRAIAESLLRQSIDAAALIQDGEQRMHVLEEIAKSTARAGHRDRAGEIVRQMARSSETPRNRSSAAMNLIHLAKLQARFGNIEDARTTLRRIPAIIQGIDDVHDKLLTWTDQVRVLTRIGEVAAARSVIGEMNRFDMAHPAPNDSFRLSGIAELQAELGDFDDAIKTLSRVTWENGDAIDRFPECLGKTLHGRDRATIRRVLTACRELYKPPSKNPNGFRLHLPLGSSEQWLIKNTGTAYVALGCMPEALEIVEELGQRAANAPTDHSGQFDGEFFRVSQIRLLAEIAEAQAEGKHVDAALATLRRVHKLTEDLKDDDPNDARELVAKALAKMGRFEEALRVARTIVEVQLEQPPPSMRKYFPPRRSSYWINKSRALLAIAEAQARGGDREAARWTLREELAPLENAVEPGSWEIMIRSIGFAQLEAGELEAARVSFRRSIRSKSRLGFDDVLDYLKFAKKQAAADDVEGALETVALMWSPHLLPAFRGEVLSELAVVCAERGDESGARKIAKSIAKDAPVQAMMAEAGLAKVRAKAGDVAGATAWANGLPQASLKAAALQGVAEGILARALGEPPLETFP